MVRMSRWLRILSRFPTDLQREISDERSGESEADWREVEDWRLLIPDPVVVQLSKAFVKRHEWLFALSHSDVREQINARFDLSVVQGQIFDPDPERVLRYARLPADTADPSIIVDGQVYFGCGRLLAALIRGDHTLRAWIICSGQCPESRA